MYECLKLLNSSKELKQNDVHDMYIFKIIIAHIEFPCKISNADVPTVRSRQEMFNRNGGHDT